MELVSDRVSNPLGQSPPCDRFVPGYGDPNADFHVVGDNPRVHGGLDTGVPFTGTDWSERFLAVLRRAGLVGKWDPETGDLGVDSTFLSYLHACDPGEDGPTDSDYATLEPFFDAELRAITAHVLLPVGARAISHVLREYTAQGRRATGDVASLHATEVRGTGWLVVPVADPSTWTDEDAGALVEALLSIRGRDFRQEVDLGRFVAGGDPYFVR